MFKKSFLIVTGLIVASVAFATDLTLLKNPYNITSLRLKTEFYQEHMAHPSLTIETINVDAKNQHVLNFSDLVTDQTKALKIMAAYSRAYLLKKVNTPTDFFKTGTEPVLKNYSHWNIHGDYLEVTFDRAQVTPSYYGIQVVDIPLSLLADGLNPILFPNVFKLKAGDLLFQDLACGELCDGINSTTYGYKNTVVSHVGMVVSVNNAVPMVIEAVSAGVKLTPLNEFLVRSLDQAGHPRVMVGRVNDQTKPLIPKAIQDAMQHLNAPYNATFSPDAKGFYCSQLITRSFFEANNNRDVFATHPMNFKTDHPHEFSPAWAHYFEELKQPIPQGKPGNNPGMLSRDLIVSIVYFYGQLQ